MGLQQNADYLDLACGTGNYTCALAALGGRRVAVDASTTMLAEAQHKCEGVQWRCMSAEHLSLDDQSFDAAICTLVIHHFSRLVAAFAEVARVQKPKARFVLFTAFPEQMERYWLCHYFPEMMRLACEQMPGRDAVTTTLSDAGFTQCEIQPFEVTPALQDFFLYSGKQRPEVYLSEAVRRGISSFRNGLCSAAEKRDGVARLAADIESGAVESVMREYQHSGGDYAFVAAHAS